MKAYILTTLLSLSTILATAQVVAIQNDRNNTLMLCLDNPLTIAVSGMSPDSISVSTDNGTIEKDKYNEGPGHYTYHAKKVGKAMVYVKKRTGKGRETIIDSVLFRVKSLPISPATVGGSKNGTIAQGMLMTQRSVIVWVDCCDIEAMLTVTGFTISISRKGKEIFRRNMQGPLFDDVMVDFFHTLMNGDLVRIENVMAKDCNDELRPAKPAELTIKDAYQYRKVKDTPGIDTVMVEDPVTGEAIMKITGHSDSTWIQVKKY
ncbi:GldM family protein [Polluticoccus soli]|uniref:GldM family protein n=1 Tax=Polluticoccus soli TaxID=3034150 RepID=UPI0023E2809A|nr:GldM family protein [Flavipsychrobacter sp. JY13-12]